MISGRTPEKPFGQRVGPQQHHGAGHVLGQRLANSHRVGADQVHLQLRMSGREMRMSARWPTPVLTA